MSTNIYLQRARLLMEQHRTAQAAEQLRQALVQDPQSSIAHALLALCLLENRDQWHEATREAEQAVGLEPDAAYPHYVLSLTHLKRNRYPEALAAIDEAIRFDPECSDFHGLKASIFAQLRKWTDALESANIGLSLNAENETCASMRSISLERLGQTAGAIEQAESAVARNPDSAIAHTTRGWTLLHSGQYRQAEESFREALRLSPSDEMARVGMMQALNNHHFVFRLIYRFYTFVGRMAQGARWALVIGLLVGMRALRQFANENPEWQPYVLPVSVLYLAFCLLSWIATPLFNTFLRFHKFGKYLLSPREKWASNLVAVLGCVAVSGALLAIFKDDYAGAILMFIAPLFLALPVSIAFIADDGWPRYTCIAFAAVLGVLCLLSLYLIASDGPWMSPFNFYGIGILIFSFMGNYLSSVTVRR